MSEGVVRCTDQLAGITSVSIHNDQGGTSFLPEGIYRVRVTRAWDDYEIGGRAEGWLLDPGAIAISRKVGTTGYPAREPLVPERVFFATDDYEQLREGTVSLLVLDSSPWADDPRRSSHNRIVLKASNWAPINLPDGLMPAVGLVQAVLGVDRLVAAGEWPDGYASPYVGELLHGIGGLLGSTVADGLIPSVFETWRRVAAGRIGWNLDRGMLESQVELEGRDG